MPDDSKHMTEAYVQHLDELRRFFKATARGKDGVDDLVQDVYVELTRHPPREAVRDPAAYLYRIAWHLLYRFNRRARAQPITLDHAALDHIGRHSDDDPASEVQAELHLVQLLRELPPLYGAVLILNRRDGMTYSEIATRLNISVSQVRRYLGRTLAHIHRAGGKTERDWTSA